MQLRPVANLTRADGHAFFALAGKIPLRMMPVVYGLQDANAALDALRDGRIDGAAVRVP